MVKQACKAPEVLYFLVLYCTLQYNTFTENSQKQFKVSDFKSPLMDASGIKSPRVAKGAKGARISRCWGLKGTRVKRVRTRTQNVEDSSILCQQHFLGENQQKLSYFHQKYQYNQTIDRLLPL